MILVQKSALNKCNMNLNLSPQKRVTKKNPQDWNMFPSLKPMYWTIFYFIGVFCVECWKTTLRINHERRGTEAVQLTSDLNPAKLGSWTWRIHNPPPGLTRTWKWKIAHMETKHIFQTPFSTSMIVGGRVIFGGLIFSCTKKSGNFFV